MAEGTDDTLREVMILILERLNQIEKAHLADFPMLIAAVRTLRHLSPEANARFKAETQALEEKHAKHPERDLSDVYAGLIAVLRNLDPNEAAQQEQIRRYLDFLESSERSGQQPDPPTG
jgi:hypothetical protein